LEAKPIPAAEVRVAPAVELTAKQRDVIYALLNPDVKMVLFSGGRGCGRTTVAQEWAKSLAPIVKSRLPRAAGSHLAVVPSDYCRDRWKEVVPRMDLDLVRSIADYRGYSPYDRIIVDDAHLLSEDSLDYIHYQLLSEPNGKILITSAPDSGAGHKWLRKHFPLIGMNWKGSGNYHVNASMFDNPHLPGDYVRHLESAAHIFPQEFTKGKW
jgi:hypothetical protein